MITFFHLFFSIFNKAFILQTYLYENVHKTRTPAHKGGKTKRVNMWSA